MDNEQNNTGDHVTPPLNTERAMDLLREVRQIHQQIKQSVGDESTIASQPTETARIASEDTTEIGDADEEDILGSYAFQYEFPETLARFKIEKLIGTGGFARVFLATDPLLDRKVALKIPNLTAMATDEHRLRFNREAKAAGILCHPSIVPVFEYGNVGPLSYIAYEYCEGKTLAKYTEGRKRHLSFEAAAKIVKSLAHAVEHAHQRGIIHRDLKPANILVDVASDGSVENLRITDFGLAKNHEQDDDSLKTTEGAIVGTPAYMSPEQAMGGPAIGKASDIYSLGVVLYELLTGKLPFETGNQIKTLHAVVRDAPEKPSRLRTNLPTDLEAICLKCLEKKSAHRYTSAFNLANDLDRWARGFSVSARQPNLVEKSLAWCKRNPGITLALIAMTIGFAVAIYQKRQADQQTKIAQQSAAQAERNIKLSQKTIKSMVSEICTSSSIKPDLGRKLMVKAIELQEQLIAETSNDVDVIFDTAYLYNQYSTELTHSQQLDDALIAVNVGIQLINDLELPTQSMNDMQKQIRNTIWVQKARVLASMKRTQEAHAALKKVSELEDEKSVSTQAHLASRKAITLATEDQWEEAWNEIQNAIVLYQSIESKNDFQKMMTDGGLANSYFWCGKIENELQRYRAAERTLLEGQRILQPVIEQASFHETIASEATRIQRELGIAQSRLGKFESARKNMSQSIAAYERLQREFPDTPRYAQFGFQLRLELLGLELETKNFEPARTFLQTLESDFESFPPGFFSDKSKSHSISQLAAANASLSQHFSATGQADLQAMHETAEKNWSAMLITTGNPKKP